MKAELAQLFKPKAQNTIKAFLADGIDMDSDEHLFICYDERYTEDQQNPVLCTGQVAKDRLADGHYRIEYGGRNKETKMDRRARRNREAVEKSRKAIETAKKEAEKVKSGEHLGPIEKDDKIKVAEKPKPQRRTVVIE